MLILSFSVNSLGMFFSGQGRGMVRERKGLEDTVVHCVANDKMKVSRLGRP